MAKIDIDKFICNLFATGALPEGSKERAYIENALQDCGLEYYGGEIVERQKSFWIEKDKLYICIKDYIIGGEPLPTSCLFTKGKIYHSRGNGYLIGNNGKSYYIYDSVKEEYFRPATEDEIPHQPKFKVGDTIRLKEYPDCHINIRKIEQGFYKCDKDCIPISDEYKYELYAEAKEPKFKVGDFIANDYCCGRVIELTDDAYLLDTEQGIPFSCEHNVHLWTIEDAKDGNVLVSTWKGHSYIYIFKEIESNAIVSHIYYYPELNTISDGIVSMANTPTVPATKEQRDLLFQKMKEEGYKWYAETLVLKKIEKHQWESGDVVRNKEEGTEWMITLDKDAEYPRNWFICRINYEGVAGGWVSNLVLDADYDFINNPLKDAKEAVDKEFQKLKDRLKKEMATKK